MSDTCRNQISNVLVMIGSAWDDWLEQIDDELGHLGGPSPLAHAGIGERWSTTWFEELSKSGGLPERSSSCSVDIALSHPSPAIY